MIAVPVVAVLLLTGIALLIDPYWHPSRAVATSYMAARDTLDFIRQWTSWMASIQTAALGGLAYLAKDSTLTTSQALSAATTVACLGAALFAAAWTLSALPIVRMNLEEDVITTENDVYEHNLYSFVPVRLGTVLLLQHTFWVIGIISFALFCYFSFFEKIVTCEGVMV
ncbi:MAG: hypothetical protein AB7G68_06185 [Nitrospiraceae bacterium]